MLHGAITFWKLDLVRAYMYHHILVEPSDVPKMAVITAFRIFKFSWMPFGLRNEGQTFQHFMHQVLCGLTFALASYPGAQRGAGWQREKSDWCLLHTHARAVVEFHRRQLPLYMSRIRTEESMNSSYVCWHCVLNFELPFPVPPHCICIASRCRQEARHGRPLLAQRF